MMLDIQWCNSLKIWCNREKLSAAVKGQRKRMTIGNETGGYGKHLAAIGFAYISMAHLINWRNAAISAKRPGEEASVWRNQWLTSSK